MKNREKSNKSLRRMIFGSLAIFIVIIIVLLWLFEVVFLETFYKSIKKSEIKSISKEITESIGDRDLYRSIEQLSDEKSVCVIITDREGNIICSSEGFSPCVIHKLTLGERKAGLDEAVSEKGKKVIYYEIDDVYNPMFNSEASKKDKTSENKEEGIIYISAVQKGSETLGVFLNARLSPVAATVTTLKLQLLILSIILIVVATLLSIFLVKRITSPILKINKSASELARSNYGVRFEGSGYKEVAELSDTLNFAASELSKTDTLQKELIANVSHDIRTPLTMIKGYAEAMRDIPGENNEENAQIVIDEATRLSGLVDDMMDLSKLEAETVTLDVSTFNLTASIRDIVNSFGKFCENNGFTINFEETEDLYVKGDKTKLSSAIYNLLSNAVNYSEDNKTVIVRQTRLQDKVRVEIIDFGRGIAPEELPFVWQRYYRSKTSHKRAVVGTGLGLSIVKKILDLHEVNFGVISTLGSGSTFWFELEISKE